jgi:hypothetical protein
MLHVAQNTNPFKSSYTGTGAALYTVVKFKKDYPLGTIETPTVSLYEFGGVSIPRSLGRVDQRQQPIIRCDVLADDGMAAARILEAVRETWQADFNTTGGDTGAVGDGYLRVTGKIKYMRFSPPQRGTWDEAGNVSRKWFDVQIDYFDRP